MFKWRQKDKFFVYLVAAYLFLSFFLVFDLPFKVPLLDYIWTILYAAVLLFSGVVYGLLTKMRIRSVVLGFSFPFLYIIFYTTLLRIGLIQFQSDVLMMAGIYYLMAPPFLISISNTIACWFVSAPEEKKTDYPISLSALFEAFSSFLNKKNMFRISLSFLFIAISSFFMIFLIAFLMSWAW
jgi:hypothetical protein